MDLAQFKKPWVIYAGLGLGLVILLSRGSGSGNSVAAQQQSSADYQAALNAAGMQFMEFQGNLAIQQSNALLDHDIKTKAIVTSALMSLDQNSQVLATSIANANAGVTQNVIANRAAVAIDRNQNDARALLFSLVSSSVSGGGNLTSVTPQLAEQNA